MSDTLGNARWASGATLGLGGGGTNPNDCSATNKQVNGHFYPVIALTNGNGYISTYIETITNGKRQWNQQFLCSMGNLQNQGAESSQIICDNGYISNGAACIAPPTPTTLRKKSGSGKNPLCKGGSP